MFSLDIVDSTQTYLLENMLEKAKEGWLSGSMDVFAASANHQTMGRGKADRKWFSSTSHKCFALSILFPFPTTLVSRSPLITQLLALSAVEAIDGLVGAPHVRLKWPNDIIIEGRKVGGILAEMYPIEEDAGLHAVIIGIGLNLDIPSEILESNITGEGKWLPGAIRQLTDVDIDRTVLRDKILELFVPKVSDFLRSSGTLTPEGLNSISSRQFLFGQTISFRDGPVIHRGIHRGISDTGCLVLDCFGVEKTLNSGEIIPS